MHVGHTRGAVFGDALAALLAFAGWDVTREYYINDGGAQVDVLARSAYERYREAHGLSPEIAEGLYPGDYLIEVGEALKAEFGDRVPEPPESEVWLAPVREFATAADDGHDPRIWRFWACDGCLFREKAIYGTGRIEAALAGCAAGADLRGHAGPPKGKLPEDWEPARADPVPQSTLHGDDVDRPVMKSDGSWTYFAPDIAYHYDKSRAALTS
jgi:arginyl-tRNA synthetase